MCICVWIGIGICMSTHVCMDLCMYTLITSYRAAAEGRVASACHQEAPGWCELHRMGATTDALPSGEGHREAIRRAKGDLREKRSGTGGPFPTTISATQLAPPNGSGIGACGAESVYAHGAAAESAPHASMPEPFGGARGIVEEVFGCRLPVPCLCYQETLGPRATGAPCSITFYRPLPSGWCGDGRVYVLVCISVCLCSPHTPVSRC